MWKARLMYKVWEIRSRIGEKPDRKSAIKSSGPNDTFKSKSPGVGSHSQEKTVNHSLKTGSQTSINGHVNSVTPPSGHDSFVASGSKHGQSVTPTGRDQAITPPTGMKNIKFDTTGKSRRASVASNKSNHGQRTSENLFSV